MTLEAKLRKWYYDTYQRTHDVVWEPARRTVVYAVPVRLMHTAVDQLRNSRVDDIWRQLSAKMEE